MNYIIPICSWIVNLACFPRPNQSNLS